MCAVLRFKDCNTKLEHAETSSLGKHKQANIYLCALVSRYSFRGSNVINLCGEGVGAGECVSAFWHMRLRNRNIETEKSEQTEYLSIWIYKLAIIYPCELVLFQAKRRLSFRCVFFFCCSCVCGGGGGGGGRGGGIMLGEESTLWHMRWRNFINETEKSEQTGFAQLS